MYGSALVMSAFAMVASYGQVTREASDSDEIMKSPPQKREGSDPTLKRAGKSTRSTLPANLLLVGPAHSRGETKDEHHNIRIKHATYIGVGGFPHKDAYRREAADRLAGDCSAFRTSVRPECCGEVNDGMRVHL